VEFVSTLIFRESIPKESTTYVNRSSVQNQETLADFVRRVRNEKNLSLTDVERRSGDQIANSYVSRIENGLVTNVSPQKLTALAKGLGVDDSEVMAIAFGKKRSDPAIEDALLHAMGYEYGKLSEKDKEALRPVLELVLEQIKQRLPKK
jgi:transcriptional regulator with XRE-family HTH domain